MCGVVLRGIVDECLGPAVLGEVAGVATRGHLSQTGEHLVAESDIGERSADHHLMVAAS